MQELVVFAIRAGFLVLLWLFVIAAVLVVRSDLRSPRAARAGSAPPAPAPTPARPAPRRRAKPPKAAPDRAEGQRAARLVVVDGSMAGTSLPLGESAITIGRGEDASLVLPDTYASSRHARLSPGGSGWVLEDLGSTNGTFLDGKRVSGSVEVQPGTPIRVGRTTLELRR